MVELVSLLLDVLHVTFDVELLFPTLESIRIEELAVEGSDFLIALEEFSVGNGKFFLVLALLETFFLVIYFPSFEFFLFELLVAFLLLPFFEIFGVVDPLVSAFETLLVLVVGYIIISLI